MASTKAAQVLSHLGTNPQDRDEMLTYGLVTLLASLGTDAGLGNAVDDVVAQLEAQFPNASGRAYVVQRVAYSLNSLRDKLSQAH